jgi:hypothetical protein
MAVRTVSFDTTGESSPFMLSVQWISGEGDGVSFDLTSGAGVGSPYLQLTVTLADGTRVSEAIDIRKGLSDWVEAIVKEAEEA